MRREEIRASASASFAVRAAIVASLSFAVVVVIWATGAVAGVADTWVAGEGEDACGVAGEATLLAEGLRSVQAASGDKTPFALGSSRGET